jgi:AcrR family transcriptional regulator
MADRKRLTPGDWTAAALAALGRGGIAAVAVEPIAASLGATKGSFYWHFSNREALLEAALREWERLDTEEVIALVEAEPDVRRRLRLLLTVAVRGHDSPGERVELALQPSARHPLVAPVLARVTARRLDYLTAQFVALGFSPAQAEQRSLLAYTASLGHAQLAHATPQSTPSRDALPAYVDFVITTLSAR